VHADHIVLATGCQADLPSIPYLAGVLADIDQARGFPVLEERFQTTVPGLFVTGFAATRNFGPFFGFVRGSTVAATIIAAAIEARAAGGGGRAPRRPPGPGTIAVAPGSTAAA
jgi:FAD-dependent urate hydroxylase